MAFASNYSLLEVLNQKKALLQTWWLQFTSGLRKNSGMIMFQEAVLDSVALH